jgi:type VI secretion system secreted protein VgrG
VDRSQIDAVDRLIGASETRIRHGVDGSGMTAAVIDSGVNYTHPALGGRFGSGQKVKAGYDFAQRDQDPMPSVQHGTSVAGLIASQDAKHPGIAPLAEIVALRVFDDRGDSDFGHISQALQWVVDHHDTEGISVVNLSISDGGNYVRNFFPLNGGAAAEISRLIDQLHDLRIPVVIASGNSFAGRQGMGYPAIESSSVSVTATDDRDRLMPKAQRLGETLGGLSATDLAAPGDGLVAPTVGRDFASVEGTSFSAGLVTGAILLLQEIYQSRFDTLPAVDQLVSWLKQGADQAVDTVTGIRVGRIDVAQAAALIPKLPAAQKVGQPDPKPPGNTSPPGPTTPEPPVVAPSPPANPLPPPPPPTPPPVPDPVPVPTNPPARLDPAIDWVINGRSPSTELSAPVATLFAAMMPTGKNVRIQVYSATPTSRSEVPPTKPAPGRSSVTLSVWNASATRDAPRFVSYSVNSVTPKLAGAEPARGGRLREWFEALGSWARKRRRNLG